MATEREDVQVPRDVGELYENWDALVITTIRRFGITDHDLVEDIKQSLYLRFVRLDMIGKYDPRHGSFVNYLTTCTRRYLCTLLLKMSRDPLRYAEPLLEMSGSDGEEDLPARWRERKQRSRFVADFETSIVSWDRMDDRVDLARMFDLVLDALEAEDETGRFDSLRIDPLDVFLLLREGKIPSEIARHRGVAATLVYRCRDYIRMMIRHFEDYGDLLSYDDYLAVAKPHG